MRVFKDFSESDLQAILQVCNDNMQWDTLNETLLREKILDDPDFDPHLALGLWEENRLIAFLFGVLREFREERIGYIKCFAVDSSVHRQSVGRQLFMEAEQRFKALKAERIRIGEAPVNYLQPGVDTRYTQALSFLKAMNFKPFGSSVMMQCELKSVEAPGEQEEQALQDQNITIRRAGYEDMQDVFEFMDSYFPRWQTQVTLAYNSLPVSLHLARHQEAIIGFAAHNTNNFGNGWFGPVAVLPEFQKRKIGTVLLKHCLQDMKDWALEQAIIPWAEPQIFFERAVHARVVRRFTRLEKMLS